MSSFLTPSLFRWEIPLSSFFLNLFLLTLTFPDDVIHLNKQTNKSMYGKIWPCLLMSTYPGIKSMCYYCSLLSWILYLSASMKGGFLSQVEGLNSSEPIMGRDCLWQRSISMNAEEWRNLWEFAPTNSSVAQALTSVPGSLHVTTEP